MAREDRVQKLVTENSFVDGVYVPAGSIASFDPEKLSGNEAHIHEVGDFEEVLVPQAAIAPTGPNPTVPQQIPPDALQSAGGLYKRPGAIMVPEATLDADQRLAGRMREGDTTEGDVQEELRKAQEETGRLRAENERLREERETAGRTALASVGMTVADAERLGLPTPTTATTKPKRTSSRRSSKARKASKATPTPTPTPTPTETKPST